MISINATQWYALLSAYIWPFVRIMGTDPFFGNRTITARVKIGMGIVLTVLMQPLLPALPAVDPSDAIGILILVHQFLIGVAIGFSLRIVFTAVEMAGHFAGLQMGLGFAMFFDPQHGTQVPVVAQLTSLLTLLTLLATDAHLLVIHTLAESFRLLPVAQMPLAADADIFVGAAIVDAGCGNASDRQSGYWRDDPGVPSVQYFCRRLPYYGWHRHVGVICEPAAVSTDLAGRI